MKTLVLNLKKQYFDEILLGKKIHEYRLCTPYWMKRLEGKVFTDIEIRCGYPKKGDAGKIIRKPYGGWVKKWIKHSHFGDKSVWVYEIKLYLPSPEDFA